MAKRHGWKVVNEIVDDGVSAFRGAHANDGALGQFVRSVKNGAYPDGVILIVEQLDRLSRQSPEIAFTEMMRMTSAGVVVATVDNDRQYRAGQFGMVDIIEVVVKAQLSFDESDKKSKRVGRAWAKKREKLAAGDLSVMTRRAPAWLRVEGDPPRFVIDEDRADVIRRIFEMSLRGMGRHSIARELNLEGIETFGRAKAWHSSSVQKLLASEAVIGTFQPHTKPKGGERKASGDRVEGYFPAVIDMALHARVTAARQSRSRRTRGRGRRLTNLFSGLATCGECNAKMTLRAKGRKTRADGSTVHEDYLVCDSYLRGAGCDNSVHYSIDKWGGTILDALLGEAFSDRHFTPLEVVRDIEGRLAAAKRSLEKTDAKAAVALDLATDSGRDEPRAMWKRLMVEADNLRSEVASLEHELIIAQGSVPPEEHRARISALRNSLDDEDEEIRFEARSKAMEALGELVETLKFFAETPHVEAALVDDRTAVIQEIELDQKHMDWFITPNEYMRD